MCATAPAERNFNVSTVDKNMDEIEDIGRSTETIIIY